MGRKRPLKALGTVTSPLATTTKGGRLWSTPCSSSPRTASVNSGGRQHAAGERAPFDRDRTVYGNALWLRGAPLPALPKLSRGGCALPVRLLDCCHRQWGLRYETCFEKSKTGMTNPTSSTSGGRGRGVVVGSVEQVPVK